MYKEGEPTRREPIQANPASQFLRVLEEISPTNEVYSLQRATTLLNQLAEEMGVEVSVSHTTFRNWVALAMAEIIEPLAFLSQQELTSEAFRKLYPDEKALPLSPTAFLFPKGGRRKNVLDTDDLKGILSCVQRVYEKGSPEYGSAKETIFLFQSKCFSLQEIGTLLEIKGKDPLSFHKKLSQLILDGVLPLNHYPTLLARTSGIPKEFFERELREQWQAALSRIEREREKKLHLSTLVKHESFVPLSKYLRPLLKARGFKLKNKYVPLLAIYLEEKDIWIKSLANKATGLIRYAISCEAQKEIEKLLGEEPFQEEIRRIASQGFTLEEYTQAYRSHFPDGTSIALTEAIRLAGGPIVLSARKKIELVKELFQEKNISLREKILILGKQKRRLTYLPIEQLAEAVSVLEEAFSTDLSIFKLTRKNTSSLTSVLFQALGRKFASRDYSLIYQRLADIKGVIRVKRGDDYSYRVDNSQLQEIINSIREREEAINQTLIEISGRKNEEGKQKDSF